MAKLKDTEVALLLALLRTGATTRASMGRILGCSAATVFRASDALVAASWIEEARLGDSTVGRRPGLIRIRPAAAHVVAIHLSADRALVSVVNANLEVVASEIKSVDLRQEGPEDLLDALDPVIGGLLHERALTRDDVKAVAMALAGRTDFAAGRPVTPPNLPLWHGHPLREEMFERWALPAVLDNDANLMALGETLRGAGGDVPHFMFVNLDIGIGAGLVLDGQIYRGTKGFSGEIGHTQVSGYSDPCACGKRGCLQAVASSPAILARACVRAKKKPRGALATTLKHSRQIRLDDVAKAAEQGDADAVTIVAEAGTAIGGVLSGAVNLLNPDLIVLGGGVTTLGGGLLVAIRKAVARDTLPGSAQDLRIKFSRLGEQAALVGAAALALELIITGLAIGNSEAKPDAEQTQSIAGLARSSTRG